MDILGYLIGAAIRTLLVLLIFYFIIRAFKRPLTRGAAKVLGIVMFLVFSILPMLITGEIVINLILGILTGCFCYSIACGASLYKA